MRELVRYLAPEKLDLFLKIPFWLHVNAEGYPGFVAQRPPVNGIWNFHESGCRRLAFKENVLPKSIEAHMQVKDPALMALYHMGSLGTFTQSHGSDFDYWVIIDKKQFSQTRFSLLKKRLDDIVRCCREDYDQAVTFFVMDYKQLRQDDYSLFETDDAVTVPKIFLKEEFYRTFLMIAGKIPLWPVLPQDGNDPIVQQRNIRQLTAMHDDLIDLGTVPAIPFGDILKGILWHICKAEEDPVKALIKATTIFSYEFGSAAHHMPLCEKLKLKYASAGIDDYGADPYNLVFERILDFHETCDPKRIHLIKTAVFFRLCGFPNVSMPDEKTPKFQLLNRYIRLWGLTQNQLHKLLSYKSWAESEKMLLENAILQRLAQMYNIAGKKAKNMKGLFSDPRDKDNWLTLKNKTRVRLRAGNDKIRPCSIYLRKRAIQSMVIGQGQGKWRLEAVFDDDATPQIIFTHKGFAGVLGWILENQLYRRHTSSLSCKSPYLFFENQERSVDMDALYLAAAPVKPLSEAVFAKDARWGRVLVFLFFPVKDAARDLLAVDFLSINTWGEVFTRHIRFAASQSEEDRISALAQELKSTTDEDTRLFFYQASLNYVPDIVYQLKKKLEDVTGIAAMPQKMGKKPYLDRL